MKFKKQDPSDFVRDIRTLRFQKILAALCIAVVSVFTVSEVITFAIWALPLICLEIWQLSDLGALSVLALTDLTVTNVVVLVMMWLLPCLFLGGMCLYVHSKLVRFVWTKVRAWIRILRRKPVGTANENKKGTK